ncbi:transporter substrate-binding domain-containing protein [Rheinheimera sp.]|uniref:transporter substrate-binding domain-containing protein n=1 Tax=Rheinheimera sp. TaxID=1869214 RepID=UPI00404760FA
MIGKSILSLMLILSLAYGYAAQATLPARLQVALSADSYPYMFTDTNGQLAGLAVDYWREVARQENIQIDFVAADWPDTIKLLQQGEVQLHGAMARTAERSDMFILTDLNIDAFSNIYVMRELGAVNSVTDLQPFVIGVVENSGQLSMLKQQLPQGNFAYFSNVTALYQAALDGQIAAFTALDRLSTLHPRYEELQRKFPLYRRLALRRLELAFAVLPENEQLAHQLATATAKLSRTFMDDLERRWLGMPSAEDTLLLGVSINNQPYMHVSLQGEAQGLFVDMWQQWSELTGTKIVLVPGTSFNNLNNLQKGRIDAIVAFPGNHHLPDNLISAHQLYSFNSEFFGLAKLQLPPLDQLNGAKIGVYENAPYVMELQQRYPKLEFVRYRALAQMVDAALNNELVGFFGSSVTLPVRLQQLNVWDSFSRVESSMIKTPLHSLVRADKPELAEQIRQGFSALTLDMLEQIEQRWIADTSERYFAGFRDKVPLSEHEEQWLSQHTPLRVGMLRDWPPMEFIDNQGKPAGVTVDMFTLLSQRMGFKFDIKLYNQFDAMLKDLQRGQIDLIANVSDQEERKSYALFTDEFWSTQWVAVSHAEDVTSINQLNGKRVAIYQDYQLARDLNRLLPQVTLLAVEDLRNGLDLLLDNKVDFVLDSAAATSEMLRQSGYTHFRVQVLDDVPLYPSLIAVRKDYQPLIEILNKGLRSISQNERQQLYQKWFSFQITQGINKEQLNRLMWQIGGVVLLLLGFFAFWNLSLRREVARRRSAEQKLRFLATHDELTRLPNRSLIKERIEQALLQHARHNEIMALLFIDLDGFKEVNDAHGHDIGDELLLKLAMLLQDAVRKSDTVARFGGDEFVVLLTGLLSRDDAAIVAEKILHNVSEPITLSVGEVQVGASIGIAVYPYDGTDSAKLLKVADSLMYRIKQQGKNRYCFSKALF